MNRTILELVIALAALYFFMKFFVRFFVRVLVRNWLTKIGRKSLARTPQQVSLARVDSPAWTNGPAVEQLAAPLRDAGFRDLGGYSVDTRPGLLIRMMHHPETFVSAHIFDRPTNDVTVEFASRYTDSSSHTLTTMPATGVKSAPWVRTIRADKGTPSDQLYLQFKTQREWHNIKAVAADEVIHEFEDEYRRAMVWRQNEGLAPEEVARVAVQWANKRVKGARTSG
jgi:hypothetical protein